MRYSTYASLCALVVCGLSTATSAQVSSLEGYWDARFGPENGGGMGISRNVRAIAIHPLTGDVYVGGDLISAGGINALRIARWDGTAWHSVGGGTGGRVHSLAFAPDGTLYVGGNFSSVRQSDGTNLDARNITRWDGTSWSKLGQGANQTVHAVEFDPASGRLYVGGRFTEVLNADSSTAGSAGVAFWDGNSWQPMGQGLASGTVDAIAINPVSGHVAVEGQSLDIILQADGTELDTGGLTFWDGDSWSIPDAAPIRIQVMEYDAAGRLIVGGGFVEVGNLEIRRLARYTGGQWESVGGQVTNGNVNDLVIEPDGILVGGSFTELSQEDGLLVEAQRIAYLDLGSLQWHALGAGIRASQTTSVDALASSDELLWVGGVFQSSGPNPAQNFAIWSRGDRPFSTSRVRFSVDTRTAEQFSLVEDRWSPRPLLQIFTGELAGTYYTFDDDRDGIHSITIDQPAGQAASYSFAIDQNGDAVDDEDFIFELDPPARTRTVFVPPSGQTTTAPVAVFDDRTPNGPPTDALQYATVWLSEGESRRVMTQSHVHTVRLSLEETDRTVFVGLWQTDQNPDGPFPPEIQQVANELLWTFETYPAAADYRMTVEWDYSEITGIADATGLTMLFRSSPDSAWTIVPTEVVLNDEELHTSDVQHLSGQWTVGSTTTDNVLTNRLPETPSVPRPGDGSLNVAVRPVLRWNESTDASTYGVYLWKEADPEPNSPTDIVQLPVFESALLEDDAVYNWKLDARNINGTVVGPTWSFRVGDVPDLEVTSVEAPTESFSGQEIEIEWTVSNTGLSGTDVPKWSDALYVSTEPEFEPKSATHLADVENIAYLNPGEGYTSTGTVRLPRGIEGPHYVHIVADGGRNLDGDVDEGDESNNVATSAPITITREPFADLIVTDVISGDIAFSSDSIDVTWTVTNTGTGQTDVDVWYDAVFLADDEQFDFNFTPNAKLISINELFLGSLRRDGVLEANGSYTVSHRVKLPEGNFGDKFLFVASDTRGAGKQPQKGEVYEFDQELDNWASRPMMVTLTPPPDLQVTSVIGPAEALSGQTVEVTWTVSNDGAGQTKSGKWIDEVFISSSAEFDSVASRLVGRFRHLDDIEPDQSYVNSGKVVIPDGWMGPSYFLVRTDAVDIEFEFTFEDNNVGSTSSAAQISLAPYPDLRIENVRLSSPAITAGMQTALTYEIVNGGDAPIAGSWVDSVFVSSAPNFVRSQALAVAGVDLSQTIGPGDRKTFTAPITLPPHTAGDMAVFVVPDAAADHYEHPDNPVGIGRSQIIEVAPYPPVDLSADVQGAPPTASSGSEVSVTTTVQNVGSARTLASSWIDRVYLSDNDQIDPDDDVVLLELKHEGAINGGERYQKVRSLVLPNGISGSKFLIFLSDGQDAVAEVSESNNVSSSAIEVELTPSADLQVTDVTAPEELDAGSTTEISWTVGNTGSGSTSGDKWFDALYLSSDKHLGNSDVLLGSFQRNGFLEAAGSYVATVDVVLPPWSAGPYYLLVAPDRRDDVYEHLGEGNNLATRVVQLTLPDPSDLALSDVVAPIAASPGDPIEVAWTLTNVGANPAKGRVREAVFFSVDETWDIGDPLLAVNDRVIDLAPGVSGKGSLMLDVGVTYAVDSLGNVGDELPALPPGSYHVIVRSNLGNSIRESDLTNNTSLGADPIAVDVPLLELGVPETMTLVAGQSRYFSVELGSDVDLRLTLTSDRQDSGNELYVASGRPPEAGGDFDWSAAEPFVANQELTVPVSRAGKHYVLVRSRSLATGVDTQELTLLAETLTFSIERLEPARAGDRGETSFVVSGARFNSDSDVFVHRGGSDTLRANLVTYRNSTQLLARFSTGDLQRGAWDFSVQNPDGGSATVENGLEIEAALPKALRVNTIGPEAARVGVPTTFRLEVENPTNVNVERAALLVRVPEELEVIDVVDPDLNMSGFFDPRKDVHEAEAGVNFLLFFFGNLRPGSTKTLNMTVAASQAGTFSILTNFQEYTRTGLFWKLLNTELEAAKQGRALEITAAEAAASKLYGPVVECDPCDNPPVGEDPTEYNIRCPIRARRQYIADQGEELAREGGEAMGEFYQGRGQDGEPLYDFLGDLACVPTGVDPCSDETPPDLPCHCDGGFLNCVPGGQAFLDWLDSLDPNDIVGPSSFGEDNWVSSSQVLDYTIRFENDPDLATAPAQVVSIRQKLDPELDLRTFRLGQFGFGSNMFSPPANVAHYRERLDLADSLGFLMDVTAGIDVISNEAFWQLKTINPETGDQPLSNPFAGFLPVNDESGSGEGFVSYQIVPDEASNTPDLIDAQASIVFDMNAPIETPAIFNTIDADPPTSTVNVLATRQDSAVFSISWTGQDVGSGIRDYSLYRSIDGGPFEPIEENVIDTTRLFVGEIGSRYRFFTLARDNAGNVEPLKNRPEAFTTVDTEVDNPAGIPREFALHQNYPNPFNPSTTIPFDLPENGSVHIDVYDIMGRLVLTIDKGDLAPGYYQHLLRMDQYASGVYLYQLRVTSETAIRFVDVGKFVLIK